MRILKLIHLLGIVLFLGSIITFIVISSLAEGASLQNIYFGRQIISAGTNVLTMPGLWMILITGILLGYKKYGFKNSFFQVKLLLALLVLVNAYLFVVPAVHSSTNLALNSFELGKLLPAYKAEYMKESIFGGINVLLTISAAFAGVWKGWGKS